MDIFFLGGSYFLETSVIDRNGNFVNGLAVSYEVRRSSDNAVIASGALTEEGNCYKVALTFAALGQYRVYFMTPAGYENGKQDITVITQPNTVAPDNSSIADILADTNELQTHQVDVSLLAKQNTLLAVKTKTDHLKDSWNDPTAEVIADTVLDRIA